MPGLLDFLFANQNGGGGLLGGMQGAGGPQSLSDAFGGNQGMMLAGLGLASGATPQEGFKNMMPALQQAYEQQNAQRAGMALLGSLPGGNQPPQQPSSFGAIGPGASYAKPIAQSGSAGGDYGKAIAGIESQGQANPYAAVGPDTGKGRAYGKYQVMDFNIPVWTKEVLGQEMTPQQFVTSPEAQDAVFKAKFGQYVQKTGNPQDAASMWFTGKPLAQGSGLSDVNGMTGQNYVNKFTQGLGAAPTAAAPAATQQPPPGSPMTNQPGAGLQLVDSPALQGMPDTVRRAIPLMLQSKTMAPQAMALIQKYINPDQWQMWRDSMGNVFTRNSATGESKPLLTPTPDMMNANASGMRSPFEYQAATQLSGSAAKNTELTGEQKNAQASGGLTPLQFEGLKANQTLTQEQKNAAASPSPSTGVGMTPAQYEGDKAQSVELAKTWVKKYETTVDAGTAARQTLPQLALAKNIVQTDPNFYSGIGDNYNLALKKIWVAAGGDPNTAASQELVGKVLSGQIVSGLRTSFGGLGQVRVAELNALQNSLASKSNTPQALTALITMSEKTQQRAADIADIAEHYNNGSGKLDAGFDRAVAEYDRSRPMFSPEEIANYKKIAEAPARAQPANPYEAEMRRRGLIP